MNADEIIFPKPIKSNNTNENIQIINESPDYFKQNISNIKLNQSQESLKSNSFINMPKEDLTFTSFKSGIDEDNFYEEISQILTNNSQFEIEKNYSSIYDEPNSKTNRSVLDIKRYTPRQDYNWSLLKKNNSMPDLPNI